MKNRKGFTLVELLVAITIVGIIAVIAIPLIRNIQGNQGEQKFNAYKNSIEQSARLYVETYGEDEFGQSESGCIIIPLEELKDKNLAKDIQIADRSCLNENSFVKVDKDGNRYTYTTYLSCGKNMKDEDADINKFINTCKIEAKEMKLSLTPTNYDKVDKQRVTIKLKIDSFTGISKKSKILYAFSETNNPENVDWKNATLDISDDTLNSTVITPSKKTGLYYLHINTEQLFDSSLLLSDVKLSSADGKCTKNDNIITCGTYLIDNENPIFNETMPLSSGNKFSDSKLSFKATDERYTTQSGNLTDMRFCLELNTNTKKCAKNPNQPDNNELQYQQYNKDAAGNIDLTDFLKNSDAAEGLNKATLYIADLAANTDSKELPINKITYILASGESGCTFKYAFSGASWGELCTPTRAGASFKEWNTKKDGTGTKITKNSKATDDITVYAIWKKDIKDLTITLNPTEYTYDGTEKKPTVTVKDGNVELVNGTDYTVTYKNNINAGTATATIKAKEDHYNTTTNLYYIGEISKTFTIKPRPTTCTASSDSKIYDGTALTKSDGTCTNLVANHTATVTYKGSQTNVGESDNTVSKVVIKNGNTDVTKNYEITKENGKLTVTKRPITYIASDQSKSYDGTALTADTTCKIKSGSGSLVTNHTATCSSTGSQTDAGNSTKTLSSVTIKNGNTDVTKNYEITKENGKLIVTKADPVCPTLKAYSGTYDGSAHSITVSGGSGGQINYRTSTTEDWSSTNPSRTNTGTTTVYVKRISDKNYNEKECGSADITITEALPPTASLTSSENLKATSQTLSISCEDSIGVAGYYLGTTQPNATGSNVSYKSVTSNKKYTTTSPVSNAGTYYLSCKNTTGKISETKSVTLYSYTVYNMLLKESISSTRGSYNTTNYEQKSSNTYIAPASTSLTLSSIVTAPSGNNEYIGYSSSNSVTSLNTGTSITLNSNKTIYAWYNYYIYSVTKGSNTSYINSINAAETECNNLSGSGNCTIKVLSTSKDTTTTDITISKNSEWNLNGKSIHFTKEPEITINKDFVISSDGTLTFDNLTNEETSTQISVNAGKTLKITGNPTITSESSLLGGYGNLIIDNGTYKGYDAIKMDGGSITINNGTFTGDYYAVFTHSNSGTATITINGGTFKTSVPAKNDFVSAIGISANIANCSSCTTTATINGGNFYSDSGQAIFVEKKCSLKITKGHIEGKRIGVYNRGTLEVGNCSAENQADNSSITFANADVVISGYTDVTESANASVNVYDPPFKPAICNSSGVTERVAKATICKGAYLTTSSLYCIVNPGYDTYTENGITYPACKNEVYLKGGRLYHKLSSNQGTAVAGNGKKETIGYWCGKEVDTTFTYTYSNITYTTNRYSYNNGAKCPA